MPTLIFPILNTKFKIFSGPAIYLEDKIKVERLTDEQYGALSKSPPEYCDAIKPDQWCIFADAQGISHADLEIHVSKLATKLRYTFNTLRSEKPIVLRFAIMLSDGTGLGRRKSRDIRVIEIANEDAPLPGIKNPYKLKDGVDRKTLVSFYKVLTIACEKYRKLFLTLNRFNSALTRVRPTDRIIDATISLESLVQDDKSELVFKFALYNSYASTNDGAKRSEVFELLKKLYNARSKIVHGGVNDEDKEAQLISEIKDVWEKIEECAMRAINAQIFFLQEGEPNHWMPFLLRKILSDPRPEDPAPN